MNKRSFNTVKLVIFFALAITMAMPATAATCNQNSCSGQIARVYVTNTGSGNQPTVYVSMVGGSSGLNCALTSGVYFTLPATQFGYTQQYNLLLQAKTTNTPVIVRAVDYSNGCTIGYVVAGQ